MQILLITEQRDGKWNKTSFETLSAAQQIATATQGHLSAVVIGIWAARRLQKNWRRRSLRKVFLVEHALLESYTPDGYTHALGQGNRPDQARPEF